MSISRTFVVVAIVVAVILAFGAFAFAGSRGDGPFWRGGGPWHGADRGWGGSHGGGWGPDPEDVREHRAALAADLAAELDTSAEDVEAALRAVAAARLQEAVDAGDIDQATADEALAAYDDGDLRALFGALKHGRAPTEAST